MSMNLNCKLGGITINLRQTPTQITNMCLAQPSGKIAWEVKGMKARHALSIYCAWLLGSLNGVWKSGEELEDAKKPVHLEIAKIQKVMRSKKQLLVYQM